MSSTTLQSFTEAIVEKIGTTFEIKFDSNSQKNIEFQNQVAKQMKDFVNELVDTHQTKIVTRLTEILNENLINKEIDSLKDQLDKETEKKQNLTNELVIIKEAKEAAEAKVVELTKQKEDVAVSKASMLQISHHTVLIKLIFLSL